MDFRGHLRLPEDAGTGIPVLLRLDDIFVVISSGDDELGTWRADDVAIERIFSNQFAIELDGESMVFIAQDALGFAYDGISAIEDLQERLTKRRVFKRSKKKDKQADSEPASEPARPPAAAPVATPAVEVSEPAAAAPAVPEPEEEPVLAFEPTAIWSPPSAGVTPAAAQPDEVAPESLQPGEDPFEPPPADVRVSYPRPATPPPAVEDFVPPDPAAADDVATEAPLAERPGRRSTRAPRIVEPTPEPAAHRDAPPEAPVEPAVEPAAPSHSIPADPTSMEVEEPALAPAAEHEYELEIEEVAPAATGATWGDEATVEVQPEEPEMEIEESVVPSAGAVDLFTPRVEGAQPIDTGIEESPSAEGRHLADDAESASAMDAARPTEEPAAEEPDEEPAAVALPRSGAPAPRTAPPPPTDVPTEEAVASNGHAASAEDAAGARESTKRERRHSLFGRSRDKKVLPHDHQYGAPKTICGLTRQVCEVCGHVTFSGEDVYQGW